jgi:stage III sporulation protein AD
VDILKIAATGVTAAVLAVTLRRGSPAFALMVSLAGCVLIVVAALPEIASVVAAINAVSLRLGGGAKYIGVAVKIIGIAYASEFGAHICADAGEAALGEKIELAGKILILAASAPVIIAMLDMVAAMADW